MYWAMRRLREERVASMALGRRGRLSRYDGVVVNLMHFDAARRGDG